MDNSVLLPLVVVIHVIAQKPPSGDVVLTERGHFAMPVVYVCPKTYNLLCIMIANDYKDYAKLTRKMGVNKQPLGSSNLRPKSVGNSSPPA